jgi:hypothetical protein
MLKDFLCAGENEFRPTWQLAKSVSLPNDPDEGSAGHVLRQESASDRALELEG